MALAPCVKLTGYCCWTQWWFLFLGYVKCIFHTEIMMKYMCLCLFVCKWVFTHTHTHARTHTDRLNRPEEWSRFEGRQEAEKCEKLLHKFIFPKLPWISPIFILWLHSEGHVEFISWLGNERSLHKSAFLRKLRYSTGSCYWEKAASRRNSQWSCCFEIKRCLSTFDLQLQSMFMKAVK